MAKKQPLKKHQEKRSSIDIKENGIRGTLFPRISLLLTQVGKQMADKRKKLGLSIQQASERSGLSTVWISQLERGMLSNASLTSICSLADVLNQTVVLTVINH